MRVLIESWMQAKLAKGHTIATALKELNEKRGTKVTHSRFAEWKRGRYTPDPCMLSQMLLDALPFVLRRAGISVTSKQVDALEKQIWHIVEEDGLSQVELL
jgi:hypothetical protein